MFDLVSNIWGERDLFLAGWAKVSIQEGLIYIWSFKNSPSCPARSEIALTSRFIISHESLGLFRGKLAGNIRKLSFYQLNRGRFWENLAQHSVQDHDILAPTWSVGYLVYLDPAIDSAPEVAPQQKHIAIPRDPVVFPVPCAWLMAWSAKTIGLRELLGAARCDWAYDIWYWE